MSLALGPGRAAAAWEADPPRLEANRHVQYIQSLDTVCLGTLSRAKAAHMLAEKG